jgi:hypothetical protein
MDSHLVQVLLPGLKELEQSCHNLFILSTRKKNTPCCQRGKRLLQHKLLGHQILVSQEYMYIRKTHNFSTDQLMECQLQMREMAQKLMNTLLFNFQDFEAKHQGHNCSTKGYLEHYIRSSTNPWSTCYKGPIQHLRESFDLLTCCRWRS